MGHFSWIGWILEGKYDEHFIHHYIHVFHAVLVTLIIIAASLFVYKKVRKTSERIVPEEKTTLTNIFEVSIESILGLMEGIVGPDAKKYFPVIGAVFIFVFVSNAFGLVPGLLPPTDNMNTGLAIGGTVFIYYNIMGIKANGVVGYLKHFLGPILWLGPLVGVIEVIGHIVRPISLSLRLSGNITGDHLVLGIFSGLVPLGVPVVFLALGLFVSFIQAFVFSLLSTIYIGLATAHEHDDHHGETHGEGHAVEHGHH